MTVCEFDIARVGAQDVLSHRPWLLAQMRRRLHDPADAEDVTQDSLIRACARLESFDGRSDLRTWLYRIAQRQASNFCRDRQTSRRYEAAAVAEWTRHGPPVDRYEDRVVSRDVFDMVLANLSGPNRTLLTMRYCNELSIEEIGEALDLGRSAVKMRLSRARGAFRRTMEDMEQATRLAA